MTGYKDNIMSYLEGPHSHFIVPVYQRNYDWKIEQCKQLFDDLIKLIENERSAHFFGSIVSVQYSKGKMQDYLLIDGQQRITTVSLLLLALYELLKDGTLTSDDDNLAAKIRSFLTNQKKTAETNDTKIKLKLTKNDQKALDALFSEDLKNIPGSNLTINYQYFLTRLQQNEVSVDDLYDALWCLEIINIILTEGKDDPQLIFESLNSTGLDLTEGDKIRNYILMGLPNDIQTQYYENYWNQIEDNAGYDISMFVRDYLSVKQQRIPNIGHVYVAFKEYLESIKPFDTKAVLKDLLAYAVRYSILLGKSSGDLRLDGCIERLNRLSTTVIRPFFLEVMRLHDEDSSLMSMDDMVQIFHVTENFVFRRLICGLPANSLNKIYVMAHHDIISMDGSEENYVEKYKRLLLNKKEKSRFPTDEEFAFAISTSNIYGMRSKNKAYLFERLENENTDETKNLYGHLDRGEYSIEHIMPQHLTPAWEKSLGENYEEIHDTWLHRLANLTLTAYNSTYSNRPFIEKRDLEHGFKKSGLRINSWIGEQNNWGLQELVERNEQLKNTSLGLWQYPTTSYETPKKQEDVIGLDDDDISLTGRTLAKYSFKGTEQHATQWVDMFQQVICMLHAENKSILINLALSDDPTVDLSSYFNTNGTGFNASRQIDDNVYVMTGTDTQSKITVLHKLFSLFGEDESELIFYLNEDESDEIGVGSRLEIRKQYWEYSIPKIRAEFDNEGPFSNTNPCTSNWISGFIGIAGIHITCVANFDGARVELYMNNSDATKNKAIFDFLYDKKEETEKAIGKPLAWNRMDDKNASKVFISLSDVSVANQGDWETMADFHATFAHLMYDVFFPYLMSFKA